MTIDSVNGKTTKFNRLLFGECNVLILSNKHMQVHKDVYPLLHEAFTMFTPTKEIIQKTVIKFDRMIGSTICVKTTPSDEIVYARGKAVNGRLEWSKTEHLRHQMSLLLLLNDAKTIFIVY